MVAKAIVVRKSLGRKVVPVRVRLPAPILIIMAVYPNGRGRGFKILTVWVRIPPQPPILIIMNLDNSI